MPHCTICARRIRWVSLGSPRESSEREYAAAAGTTPGWVHDYRQNPRVGVPETHTATPFELRIGAATND